MDRRYMISLTVIAVLIVLFIISVAFSPKEEVIEDDKIGNSCEQKCRGVESCLKQCSDVRGNVATLNNDASECEKINDLEKRNECLKNVGLKTALNSEDESLCEDENCRNSVKLSKALSSNDPSLCEEITIESMRLDCLEITG